MIHIILSKICEGTIRSSLFLIVLECIEIGSGLEKSVAAHSSSGQ
jgi:hypothetical protein